MNTIVNIRDPQPAAAFRAWVEARIRVAFLRFGRQVVGATATVADENGPRGGVDKRCTLSVRTTSVGRITIVSRDASPHRAVSRAVRRARRALQRKVAVLHDRRYPARAST